MDSPANSSLTLNLTLTLTLTLPLTPTPCTCPTPTPTLSPPLPLTHTYLEVGEVVIALLEEGLRILTQLPGGEARSHLVRVRLRIMLRVM